MKIAVVTPKNISGERGGAENFYEGLVGALNDRGHHAVQVEVLVDESSFEGILEAYSNCFYLNLDDYDLVISTKAPTYMVRHRNHISYLLHTIRVFYDMFDTEYDIKDEERQKQRRLIHEFDKYGMHPSRIKRHCVIGETVAKRLRKSSSFWDKIKFEIIHPAVDESSYKTPKKGEFIFLPGRLHKWKRVDLVINAMKYVDCNIKLLIAGEGDENNNLRILAKKLGLEKRVEFLGRVSNEKLAELYSESIVVPFIPVEEDYGYITIEAFKSKKPVITCHDSGEPSVLVEDGISGYVVDPDPKKIAEMINYFIKNPDVAARMGEKGYLSVQDITWDDVVSKLLFDIDSTQEIKEIDLKVNVLITDIQPIEPAIGGGRLRLKGLYSNFPPGLRTLYVGTYDWKGQKRRELKVSDSLSEIDIPLSGDHFLLNEHLNKILPGKTIIDSIFPLLAEASLEYVNFVRDEAKKADVVVLSHPWLYPAIKTEIKLKNKVLIYDSQNCEAILRKKLLGETPFARCISQMVKYFERELCEDSDLILACSEDDKEQFMKLYNINSVKIEVVPNGVFVDGITPVDEITKEQLKDILKLNRKTALFIGSEYPPNVEAGRYIIDTLAERCPNIDFLILGGVGNNLSSGNITNVKILGVVSEEDKKKLYYASDIAINPMLSGSGTNIKMFDFLAAGLPTISSPVGARGIENNGAFIVTDLCNFPQQIIEILSNRNLYNSLSSCGRKLVEEYYDWNMISNNLGKRIHRLYFNKCPYFSIVVATNRGETINELIKKLNQQFFDDFELIVVDSYVKSRDHLYEKCEFKLKYIYESDVGATKARNIGLKYARGKIIVFTDDDCQPDSNWLENAKNYFEVNEIVGLEGYIYTDETKINNPKYRIITNKGFEGIGFMTANLFIRHDILDKVGCFDERFDNPHFREDTELAWRVQEYGPIPFAKDVRVYHPPHLRKLKGESNEERDRFFVNDSLLFKEYPEKYIRLMKAEQHYINNSNYWKFFLEGCKRIKDHIPIEHMLNEPEIRKHIPNKIKLELKNFNQK